MSLGPDFRAKAIVARRPDLDWRTSGGVGGTLVIFNRYRVVSCAMARLKTNNLERYRSKDKRDTWTPSRWWTRAVGWGDPGKGMEWRIKKRNATEAELRARLSAEGPDHKLIAPGGAWWRHVQIRIAERNGDLERLAQLKAQQEQSLPAILGQNLTPDGIEAQMRKRTIKLYRLSDDGRRLLAGKLEAGSPAELVAKWRAFLATTARGVYFAHYRGEALGIEASTEAAHSALAA